MPDKVVTACLLIIGNEILSGRTKDANLAYLGAGLNEIGVRLTEARVIPDQPDVIVATLNEVRQDFDYVFTTGGIGPTHDDITVDAVARALGVKVIVHPDARAILEKYYATRGGLTEGRLRMARVPEGAELIENRMSGAPGIRIDNLYLMAGVPHITAGMLDALTGTLEGGAPLLSATLGAWAPESEIAGVLRDTEKAHEACVIGSYPFFRDGTVGANFVVRSTDPHQLEACRAALKAGLEAAGYEVTDGGI